MFSDWQDEDWGLNSEEELPNVLVEFISIQVDNWRRFPHNNYFINTTYATCPSIGGYIKFM